MKDDKIYFAEQETPNHKFVLVQDTICEGEIATTDENGHIELYTKEGIEQELKELLEHENNVIKEEAENDGDTYEPIELSDLSWWSVPMDEYIHNKKTIFGKDGLCVVGIKPIVNHKNTLNDGQ